VNKTNAPRYIVCTLGMEGKNMGQKMLVANATNVVVTYMQLLHGTYAIKNNILIIYINNIISNKC
jgi:hypothetical protein